MKRFAVITGTSGDALRADAPDELQRYRFGLHTADFLLCKRMWCLFGRTDQNRQGRFCNAQSQRAGDAGRRASRGGPNLI